MALFITTGQGRVLGWNVGQPAPQLVARATSSDLVDIVASVQADGDELEKIRKKFSNVRMVDNRVVTWTGDDAVFIVQHLFT